MITEKYLWQGLTRLLAVYDASDSLLMRFEYADARMPMAMTRGGALYYLTYDQVGSLRVVADSSGSVVKRVDYDSFGNIIGDTNPTFEVPFGFAGGLHDRDTGLVRFGFRDYDPDIGRWTAKDPILFAGGDTDLYGYCLYNPVNLIDPDGLGPFTKVLKKALKKLAKDFPVKQLRKHLREITDLPWHPFDIFLDPTELANPEGDSDGDGIPDWRDDSDGDGIDDYLDKDDDNDGIPDDEDELDHNKEMQAACPL